MQHVEECCQLPQSKQSVHNCKQYAGWQPQMLYCDSKYTPGLSQCNHLHVDNQVRQQLGIIASNANIEQCRALGAQAAYHNADVLSVARVTMNALT